MIELKNVSKTYKSKKSKSTKALDDVSLTFNDKGMTFILGKSGSGKSTLLNVLGGLDKYDTGDMLILGKSSRDFTQADFDSYRNTYVGFIFQEFNILNDYDVYENIVLALQLQQKEVNEEEINKLLDKLELTELKKRKVNELSGGQKQRVAIARAIIKNPKIILADEPTGNLDSKTGTDVMNLLTEIAKEKLVVIVSHDEEYAKKYGNRIIEIKDGKIIHDTKEEKVKKDLKNNYMTIKSKLPFKESFKLGLGSIKHKKVKLVFTILLTVATLGFLSCTDTLSCYNFNTTHAKYLSDQKEQFVEVEQKHIYNDKYGYVEMLNVPITDASYKEIVSKMGKEGYTVYKYQDDESYGSPYRISNLFQIEGNVSYEEDGEAEIVATSEIANILKENIIGRAPNASNEVVISNFVANQFIKNGVHVHETVVKTEFKESNLFSPKSYEDILNTEYNYYFGVKNKVKIVGIIDYDSNTKNSNYIENVLLKIYVHPDFIDKLNAKKLDFVSNKYEADVTIGSTSPSDDDSRIRSNVSMLDHTIEYFDGNSWKKTNSLKANEIILSMDKLTEDDQDYYENKSNYLNKNNDWSNRDAFEKRYIANYIMEKNVIGKPATFTLYYDNMYNGPIADSYNDLKVIGVYYEDSAENSYNNIYLSKELLEPYIQVPAEKVSILYPMTEKVDFKSTTDKFPYESELAIKSTYSKDLYYEKHNLDMIKQLAFYASIVFLIFTTFLIINFMFNSISYRKKEIGVLRALGSRSKDVMKIFLWEGVVLSLISGTIASILLVVVSNFLNSYIKNVSVMLSEPFLVGIRQFLVIYIVVFIVTMISSVLPIIKISKMKPIDAILNK